MNATPRLRDQFAWPSRLSYLSWRLGVLGKDQCGCKLRSGLKVIIRPRPAEDIDLAAQIFALRIYEFPWPMTNVRRIVDLGANVGYASLYFAYQFPESRIDAFEPHPVHLQQLKAMIDANSLQDRVIVHPVAVGSADRQTFLTDAGTASTLAQQGLPIQVIDWFSFASGQNIDFLKVDIEGAEDELFADPRIDSLAIPYVIVEWHETKERPFTEQRITEKLSSLGYEFRSGERGENPGLRYGNIYARRR